MLTPTITLEVPPNAEVSGHINQQFHQHNVNRTGDPNYEALSVVLRDEQEAVIGGLIGCLYYGWLHVEVLWVEAALRGNGYGGQLLAQAETRAVAQGCIGSTLETSSPDARRFYERHRYEVFATLDDYPPGHQKLFMRKRI